MQTSFSLLETMRLEDGRVARLERHLARMAASARHFDFGWNQMLVDAAVEEARAAHAAGTWRLRLLLDPSGKATTTCTPHEAGDARAWRVAFAKGPVHSTDEMLRHKTTNRALYDSFRGPQGSAPHVIDDVILWNERGEVTESTIANIVVEFDGARVTPPVSCGLLPGVYRGELLDRREIHERVITKEELAGASRFWLINSLRGWIEARW